MKIKLLFLVTFYLQSINVSAQENHNSKNSIEDFNKKYKKEQKEKKSIRKEINGSTLEELNFEDIYGNKHTLESLKGKVIVFNFWFIHCKPCIEEIPDLNALTMKFKNKPVVFFAVATDDKNSLKTFLTKKKFDYTIVSDRVLTDRFKIPYFPYNVIIDQSGKVEYVNDLLSFNIINKIERKINRLL